MFKYTVTSECTALLSWKLGFRGVWNLIGTEHSLNRSERRVKSKAS